MPLHNTVLVVALAALAPLLSDRLSRWLRVPSTVIELLLGVIVGGSVLGLVQPGDFTKTLAEIGVAMLFFLAGYEIRLDRLERAPTLLAGQAWLISLALGLAAGAAVAGFSVTALIVGVVLTTTALGTFLPIARDAGDLSGPFGVRLLTNGGVGELGPILAIALFLSRERPIQVTIGLIAFTLLALGLGYLARRRVSRRVRRLLVATLGTSAQFAVRLCMLMVIAMVFVATILGLDVLLGGFAAGIVARLLITHIDDHEAEVVESKLEAIGYGFLVPFFFIISGVRLDLGALAAEPLKLLLVPVFFVGFLVVRGLPAFLVHTRDVPGRRDRLALALYTSTALPLVVVISEAGVQDNAIDRGTASALVAAGMASVLTFPMAALWLRRGGRV